MDILKFSDQIVKPESMSSLGYWGINVPEEIVAETKSKNIKRFIVKVNDLGAFPSSFIAYGNNQFMILLNTERRKKLQVSLGDSVHVEVSEDTSEFGMPMPEEMQEVMFSDPEGETHLRSLTPGKIRSLIHLVAKVKSTDKRIEKSVVIFEHLRTNHGTLDYKMLNVAFKEYGKI